MKGGLAAMMLRRPRPGRARSACASTSSACRDEESEEVDQRGSDYLVEQGYVGDFAITGEPTDLHIGVQAKGVLAMRIEVTGTAAHGSTPWIGDNAVLKAIDVFRQIESLPFARESSDLFDRPSINLGRIVGGDALNKVPDLLRDRRGRALPAGPGRGRDPRPRSTPCPTRAWSRSSTAGPAIVDRDNPFVQALGEAIARVAPPAGEQISVGRDGASDAISFLEAGVPAVEFGPAGGGHHGPEEWVSIRSLGRLSASARRVRQPAARPGSARTSAACGSPDARGHPPPRTLEAPPARRRPRGLRRRGRHLRGGVPRGRQGRRARSSSSPSSSSARASSPRPTPASRRR